MFLSFPIISGKTAAFPDSAKCPMCGAAKVFEPHSFATLSGGALLVDRATNCGEMSDDLDGFLSLHWHGAHESGVGIDPGKYCKVDLALDCRGGQFEFYFCSTKCLRQFLNKCVDELENEVQKAPKVEG